MNTKVNDNIARTLITVEEAATLLGVKRQTVYLWVRRGSIPCYRVGKRLIKFDADELLACFKVEQGVTAPRPPKVEVCTYPLAEPFRTIEKLQSPEAQKERERYRALLGVVK